jgi:transcriptional regulator with PAS, ATPase and Fis domain
MNNKTLEQTIPDTFSTAQEQSSTIDTPITSARQPLTRIPELVEFMGMVLNNVYSGIIVCDTECRIIFMNEVYADLLKVDRHKVVGEHIKEYFPHSRLSQVLATGMPEIGQKCSFRTDTVLLVNRIPLKTNGKTVGVILQTIFRDYKDFRDLVTKLNLLERAVKYQKLALEVAFSPIYNFDSIIGESNAIKGAKTLANKFAKTDSPVLIMGATGTGKELFAHAIHSASGRSGGPFVCVNCASVPKDLLESELFGYETGAFTGAKSGGKPGRIELADGGTLFLDEIGELPLNAQAKLLRVTENKVLDRIGGTRSSRVDFRLVAATNRDLQAMINSGEFRDDLYYRLNTMIVEIPRLSQRPEDIPILAKHFLRVAERIDINLSSRALAALETYDWPGNVRELKSVIDRALSLAENSVIDVEQLTTKVLGLTCGSNELSGNPYNRLSEEMALFEKTVLARAIKLTSGNMSRASKLLGISRSTLYEKCQKHNLVSIIS